MTSIADRNYRMVTLEDVLNVASYCMTRSEVGVTNVIEVRDELRKIGFWALASEIAPMMELLAQSQVLGWVYKELEPGGDCEYCRTNGLMLDEMIDINLDERVPFGSLPLGN